MARKAKGEFSVSVAVGGQDCGRDYDVDDLQLIGEVFLEAARQVRQGRWGGVGAHFAESVTDAPRQPLLADIMIEPNPGTRSYREYSRHLKLDKPFPYSPILPHPGQKKPRRRKTSIEVTNG